MKLKLQRTQCGDTTTVGQFFVDGEFECFCIEDQDRQLENDPAAKVYGKTCIPRGKYKIIITWSNRFKRELPILIDVPGFTGVRIHPGNTHEDTEGCLLPATSVVGSMGMNSRNAFFKLGSKIANALDNGDDVEIEVV